MKPISFENSRARHYLSVSGIGTCSWTPKQVISCSIDQHVCIWDVETNEVKMQRQFEEELLAMSVHSSGLFLLVSSVNKLSLIGIYAEETRIRELGSVRVHKSCICEFANFDDKFAFVYGTVIKIYSIIKFKQIGAIRSHELGRIKQLKYDI